MVHPPVYHAQIEQELIAITKAVLHKEVLKPKQNLFEQGLTSVGVLEIRSRLEKRFQISLQSSTLFDYPIVAALTTCIIERLCSRAAIRCCSYCRICLSLQAAANAFIDGLMNRYWNGRRVGLAINWGPWASIGMAAELTDQQKKIIERRGIFPIPLQRGDRGIWPSRQISPGTDHGW